jgi:CheY-like chemotaxis protein
MPALLTQRAPRTVQIVPELPIARDTRRTVLVVEDDASVRSMLRRVLERTGHRVLLAADGEAAALLLHSEIPLPDLVLTDLWMPGMGGQELGRWIEARFPSLPVIYMSGCAPEEGMRGVLRKPFDLTAFLERILTAV